MAALTYKEFVKKVKSGEPMGGIFIFFGDEDYTKADAVGRVKKLASESGFPEFNVIRISGTEFSADALSSAVETAPLMSELKAVEISGADIFGAKRKDTELLAATLISLESDVAVMFVCPEGSVTEKDITASEIYKSIQKKTSVTLVECKKATPSELVRWIGQRMAALGVTAVDDTSLILAKRCGYSMFALVSEINKLAAYVAANGRTQVTTEDVVAVVSDTVEVGAFELTNAISDRRIADALSIYAKMKNRGDPARLILSSITSNFAVSCMLYSAKSAGISYQNAAAQFGLNEYRAKLIYNSLARCDAQYIQKALRIFSEADKKSKSLDTDLYTQVEQLIASLA